LVRRQIARPSNEGNHVKFSARTFVRLAAVAAGLSLSLAAPAAASAAPPAPVTFQSIVSFHTGKCVDVPGASQQAGLQLQQFSCNGTNAQLWTKEFTDSTQTFFRLRVAASDLCMTVKDASQANLAPVVQSQCGADFNQQWQAVPTSVGGYVELVARHSGKALIMQSEAIANGAKLIQSDRGSDPLHSRAWLFA
jgi:hypothetical protein